MKKLIHYSKGIVLLITAILIIQIFLTAHLLKANFYLKHQTNGIRVVEKKVLAYKDCEECPPCRSMVDIQAQ